MRHSGVFHRSQPDEGHRLRLHSRFDLLPLFVAFACGGASPGVQSAASVPVAAATSAAAPTPSAAPAASTVAPVADRSAADTEPPTTETPVTKEASADSPAPASSPPSLAQSPTAVVTAARAAFLLDYANSEAKTKAAAGCAREPKNEDPTAMAGCLDKARTQFVADVLVFKSDPKGHARLTIYKRTDSALREVFSAPVSLKDEGPNALQVKFKGAGNGQRPLFKSTNSPTIRMPNSYTLEIDDPQYGKLSYDAKIGLVN